MFLLLGEAGTSPCPPPGFGPTMIDYHSHILPAIDDGAVTIDDSIAMARELANFGYRMVCCTPHCIRGSYEPEPQRVREATLMLQADLDNAGIRLELRPGMEYHLDECFSDFVDNLLPLGGTRLVLCEAPQKAHPAVVCEALELILDKGFVPLIAHPERSQFFFEKLAKREVRSAKREEPVQTELTPSRPSLLKRIFAPRASRLAPPVSAPRRSVSGELPAGIVYHANLGSFTGYYGEAVQRRAYDLLRMGAYTALASDLHDPASADLVLVRDKIETNPLVQRLAAFDGRAAYPALPARKGQGSLF